MMCRFFRRWSDHCSLGRRTRLGGTSAMNRMRSSIARTGAIFVAGAIIVIGAGCHHKTVDDFLAEGDTDMQTTKLADAEKAYQEAEKLAPNDPRVAIALGNLYIFEHKPDDAQVEFMKVLELDPKNAATHVALGNLYNDQNQRGAADQIRTAIGLNPKDAKSHLALAELLASEPGRTAEAGAEFDEVRALDP